MRAPSSIFDLKLGRQRDWVPNEEEVDAFMKLFNREVMTQGVGASVDKTRERAIMGYITNARKSFSRAFNAFNCCKGWQLAGLCPFDPELILSKWSGNFISCLFPRSHARYIDVNRLGSPGPGASQTNFGRHAGSR